MSVKILTANDLRIGQVVFYAKDGSWSPKLAQARIAHTKEDEEELARIAGEAVQSRLVVEAEIIPAEERDSGPWPTRNREQIRALGPTVREDLGDQAEGVSS